MPSGDSILTNYPRVVLDNASKICLFSFGGLSLCKWGENIDFSRADGKVKLDTEQCWISSRVLFFPWRWFICGCFCFCWNSICGSSPEGFFPHSYQHKSDRVGRATTSRMLNLSQSPSRFSIVSASMCVKQHPTSVPPNHQLQAFLVLLLKNSYKET